MMFDILFYSSLCICVIGICYKLIIWTNKTIGYQKHSALSNRFPSLISSFFSVIFSSKIVRLFQSLLTDVLFQKRSLNTSVLRWGMHLLIFIGFMGLVLMHALDTVITEKIWSYYYATINPFFFLRNVFALMVLGGIGIAVYRRYFLKPARLKNAGSDLYAIGIVLMIILSGIVLEGMKMSSVSEFTAMVEDYAGLDYEDEDVIALEAFWVKDYALVSDRIKKPFGADMLALGQEVHETNCADCHSPNTSAFLGYATARLLSPVAVFLDKADGVSFFYYVHIIVCFLGLALIPFTKMFHIVSTPVSLLANSVQDKDEFDSKNFMTKQLMELDACTHCSTCNLNCSAGMMYESIKNDYILPSEKLKVLKKSISKDQLNSEEVKTLFQGLYICTNCDRCTVVCPSGIDLKSLWLSVREKLLQQNPETPLVLSAFSFVRGLNRMKIGTEENEKPVKEAFRKTVSVSDNTRPLTIDPAINESDCHMDLPGVETFSHCFGCQSCSTICPVVATYDAPEEELVMMPHQIMYSLGLGLADMAKESAMIWDCLSCYQCQENCPQNVTVTDILFQLKNKAFQNFQDKSQ